VAGYAVTEAKEPFWTPVGCESLIEAIGNGWLFGCLVESLLGRVMTRTQEGDAMTICVQTSVLPEDGMILLCPIYPRANFSIRGVRLWIDRSSTKGTSGGE